ncbi:MAG TPA: tetratricopeptide repeat protein [Acidobacteriota bacterium]
MIISLLVSCAFQQLSAQTNIAHLRSIWDLADKGENQRALQRAREYLQKEPFSVEGLDLAGVLATRLGSLAEARDYLVRAVRAKPDSPRVLSNLGFVHLQEKNPAEAIRFLRAALALDPKLADAWSNLASAFALLGDKTAAEAAKRESVDPDEQASPCVALAKSLRSAEQPVAQFVSLQKPSNPCDTHSLPILLPDLPAVVRLQKTSVLSMSIKDTALGVWIFWSSPSPGVSGSARVTNDSRIEISLPESGVLYLTASRSVEIENWSVH